MRHIRFSVFRAGNRLTTRSHYPRVRGRVWGLGLTLALAAGAWLGGPVNGATTNDPSAQLTQLVGKINDKLQAGKRVEADFAPELQEFDTLLEEHKGEKTDAVAEILNKKISFYIEVLEAPDKAIPLVAQAKRDFPESRLGKQSDEIISELKEQAEVKRVRDSLVEGATFPPFEEKDVAGKPLSLAAYKGKVVLVDFWATWCPPCRAELPHVIKAYEKYHSDGFEIVGISLDQDEQKLKSFLAAQQMTWPQYFDGKGWSNKLARKYGITSIPATFLLDGQGKIIGKDFRGDDLDKALAKALKKQQ